MPLMASGWTRCETVIEIMHTMARVASAATSSVQQLAASSGSLARTRQRPLGWRDPPAAGRRETDPSPSLSIAREINVRRKATPNRDGVLREW